MNWQLRAINKTKRYSYLVRLVPWVKSIVIINSVASGKCGPSSDIDLMLIVSTRRLYISKFMVRIILKALGQLESKHSSVQKFSLGTFIDTTGIDWRKHGMLVNQDKFYKWIDSYIFIYGDGYDYLMNLDHVHKNIRHKIRIPIFSLGLDYIDKYAQHVHYKHTLSQHKNWQNHSFIRLEPNIISLHAFDDSIF
jgi:predicted nucleotidyltransferase